MREGAFMRACSMSAPGCKLVLDTRHGTNEFPLGCMFLARFPTLKPILDSRVERYN